MPISDSNSHHNLIIICIGFVNLASAICISLQAPFYPREAESKGATPSEYGLVFGIFELVVFISSFVFGKYLPKLGVNRTLKSGIFVTGLCCILFGLLGEIQNRPLFIGASILVRGLEAIGNSAFLTSSFSIIAQEFPESLGKMFSILEMCFGLGLILGPTIGANLYELGGFDLPFIVMGSILIISALLTVLFLPPLSSHTSQDEIAPIPKRSGFIILLQYPPIILASLNIFNSSCSIGFLQATLEPHIRVFNLSPLANGLMFVMNGGTYAFTTIFWGWLCDKKLNPKIISILGGFFLIVSFLLMGPAPYVPIDLTLNIEILALILHGVSLSALLVSGFTDAHREAISCGFDDSIQTYALVSSLWTSTFALGAFVGPALGSLIMTHYGFPVASTLILLLTVLGTLLTLSYVLRQCKGSGKGEDYESRYESSPTSSSYQTFSNDDRERTTLSIASFSKEPLHVTIPLVPEP